MPCVVTAIHDLPTHRRLWTEKGTEQRLGEKQRAEKLHSQPCSDGCERKHIDIVKARKAGCGLLRSSTTGGYNACSRTEINESDGRRNARLSSAHIYQTLQIPCHGHLSYAIKRHATKINPSFPAVHQPPVAHPSDYFPSLPYPP